MPRLTKQGALIYNGVAILLISCIQWLDFILERTWRALYWFYCGDVGQIVGVMYLFSDTCRKKRVGKKQL